DVPFHEDENQAAFAGFAWRTFASLNWPASREASIRGAAHRGRTLRDPGPRVWESFKSDIELFPWDGDRRVAPTAWSSYAGPNPCGADNREKTVASFRPFADFNQPSFMAGAPANPLVAQNRTYTRYEIHVNEAEFTTFAAKGWSLGQHLPDEGRPADFPAGSVSVKAAWRQLTAADPPDSRARYYVVRANVVDVAKTLAARRIVCSKEELALVGLHIAIKTRSRPQWIWSSFEHVDNVPPAENAAGGEPDAKNAGVPYGYFDPAKPRKLWPPFGSKETLPLSDDNPAQADPTPTQVIRRHKIDPTVMAINRVYWATPEIRGSVWANYMLVAVQWPTSREPPGPTNDGAFLPGRPDAAARDETYRALAKSSANLVNTTMETYLQDAPSSCMACHQATANARGHDFVAIEALDR
ncbi:MAG: hypothetical protein JO107_07310, partial [Hyphomicrobiales bacterium]|nr:hypothetical protein [Hyphomicrobiales bacterium]